MSDWHDPNIEILSSSPSYDPTKPMKTWVDKRSHDTENTEQIFIYNKLVRDKIEQFALHRAEAGEANIPSVGLAETNNTSTWNRLVVPIPIRDLELGESIVTDPFGQVIITQEADRTLRLSDLNCAVGKIISEIRAKHKT